MDGSWGFTGWFEFLSSSFINTDGIGNDTIVVIQRPVEPEQGSQGEGITREVYKITVDGVVYLTSELDANELGSTEEME